MTISRRKLLGALALATGFGGFAPKLLANMERKWAKPPIDVELDKNGRWVPKKFYVGDLVRFASGNKDTSHYIGQIEGIYESYDRYNQQFNGLSGYTPPTSLLREGKIINARTSERHYLLGYMEDFELVFRVGDVVFSKDMPQSRVQKIIFSKHTNKYHIVTKQLDEEVWYTRKADTVTICDSV
jgi:hypothetical protein